MSLIQQLSYLVIESNKTAEWKSYATDFLGMAVSEGPGDFMRIRMDLRAYRLLFKKAEGKDASEDIGRQVFKLPASRPWEN